MITHLSSPEGPGLRIEAEDGPMEISFNVVQIYHGHGALAMLALIYQGLRGALPRLESAGHPVQRNELSVVSGHPGPGVRDAFECVTRAVTRGCYVVDHTLPHARYAKTNDKSYSFLLRLGSRQVQAVLRDGVLPSRFFDLMGNQDMASQRQHAELRREIASRVLTQSPDELFEFTVQDVCEGGRQ